MTEPAPGTLLEGIATVPYVYERRHALLAADAHRGPAANIGRDGANLTISCLSLNRSGLTRTLLDSIARQIPDFRGEVLVIDNGSEAAEAEALRAACSAAPFAARVEVLGANYGVGGGRNRTMPHVRTDWVLLLDNDIFFQSNPLPRVQRDLAVLGCHFLNLPLLDRDGQRLFARGGHLYVCVEGGRVHIGAGSAYVQGPHPGGELDACLSTFLFGGAAVVNRHTFAAVGGFDEGMFIGFEDIDFSIRLFRAGLKVGNSGAVALVHDHPAPTTASDKDYERQRFARDAIRRSAEHLERKYGMVVWSDAVDEWLQARHRQLGLTEVSDGPPPAAADPASRAAAPAVAVVPARPRVMLVLDTESWAFGNIARQLQRHLAERFEFRVVPMDVVDNVIRVLLLARDCDIVHFFWREHLQLIQSPYHQSYVANLGGDYAQFFAAYVRGKALSTSVYDHLLLAPEQLAERRPLYTDLLTGYYVGSERLRQIYAAAPGYPPPAAVLPDGVDRGLFYPQRLERLAQTAGRELVLGWVGNSRWGGAGEDYKGVETILKPAVAQLRAEGLPLRLELADRASGTFIPHAEMVHWYAGIDVYVCTSLIEGTPNPVLESMACGVPIVSTDVGIVPEAFGPRQHEFILPERSVAALQAALRRLVREPALLPVLSAENLERAAAWDWRINAARFGPYFDELLRRRATRA